MAPSKRDPIVIGDLRGGRNDTDPPMALPPNQGVECLNVDWKDATLARKRGGATSVALTGGTAFDDVIATILRHVPGAAETAAELWAFDADRDLNKRLTGGTSWADVTFDDAIATDAYSVVGASLNGKLFLAYDSSVDRLHCYDPSLASARVRRVGINPGSTAPTAGNSGSGSHAAATIRYYRVRFLQVDGTRIVRWSEPTPSVSFTPSGSGGLVRVTRPTAPGEGETHWHVEASATETGTYYIITNAGATTPIAIATTTDDDPFTGTPSSVYPTRTASEPADQYELFPSVKTLITDGNRLIGAGAWESSGAVSGGKGSRVWFTPVLGTTDKGDDERVPNTTTQKNWIDLNENDGGPVIGLGGPLNGIVYAFKYRQIHRLRPTGDPLVPYLARKIRDDVGCVAVKTITLGEDERGDAALYFLSHRGPYRITIDGAVQYLGRDNEVTWRSVNLGATTLVSHAVFYPDLHQWWVWIATSAANVPDVKMMFDVQRGFPDEHGQIRGGWAKHTGNSAAAACSCLFANTLGASMSKDLKPHIGRASGTLIWKCDTSDLDDGGTDFQAYVKSRPILASSELGRKIGMQEPLLLAKVLTGVTVTLTTDRDFGAETRTHTALLTAAGTETRVLKKFEGGEVGEADVIQVQVGDGSAQEGAWTLDALVVPKVPQEIK